MVGQSSMLDIPFHADFNLLGQCRRRALNENTPKNRGISKSVAELQDTVKRYINDHNKPFVWTVSAEIIFEKLDNIHAPSD